MTGTALRQHRSTLQLTQRALADAIGVNANTVARWERDELPIPSWVMALLQARADVAALTAKLKALTSQYERLQVVNFALEHKLRERRKRSPVPRVSPPPAKPELLYKRLVRKYHPDRDPKSAAVMADINELWQALTSSPRSS